MSLRLRAALLDLLVWAGLLDGVLWLLTWVDVHDASRRGTAVPAGLGTVTFAGAAALSGVALATAVTWWRQRRGGRAWFAMLGVVVALTAHEWAHVPAVGWLQWASYALAATIGVAVLPGAWTSARHLGVGRRRWARVLVEFGLLLNAFLIAPSAAMGLEVGLIHPHALRVSGQTGWELLLPAVASCTLLLALATQLARGKPASGHRV